MAVAQYRDFAHRDVLPATWTDAVERYLTSRENFIVRRASATTVEVPAGDQGGGIDLGPAGLIIGGKPRWNEATTNRAVAGGAGTYDLWAVGAANSFAAGAPAVGEIDNTFYGFELRVVASGGAAPVGNLAGGQPITLTRKLRTIAWDGAAITGINRLASDGPQDWLLALSGVKLGTAQDVSVYRSAADELKTDDTFRSAMNVYAQTGLATQAVIGVAGPGGEAGIGFGSAVDAVLYRVGASQLKTASSLAVAGGYSLGAALSGTPAYQSQQVAAQTVLRNKLLPADANDAFHVLGDGKHEWGAGGASALDVTLYRKAADVLATDDSLYMLGTLALFGNMADANAKFYVAGGSGAHNWGVGGATATDTTLYRSGVGTLKTDGTLYLGSELVVGHAGAANHIYFGGALDANLYRSAAGALKTDGFIQMVQARVDPANAGSAGGVYWGTTFDTNLYRRTAGSLKTDTQFEVAGALWVDTGGIANKILFGASFDTNLYRSAADTLKTDDNFYSVLQQYANLGGGGQAGMGNVGPGGTAGLLLGSASDVNLYRSAAAFLSTDGSLAVGTGATQVILTAQVSKATLVLGGDTQVFRVATAVPSCGLGNPLTLKSYTEATKPAAGNVTAGSVIYVTDGAVGSRAQMAHGGAWLGIG